jgi:hypothetical protein
VLGGARQGSQAGTARAGECELFGELQVLGGEPAGGGEIAPDDERLAGGDAPGGEAGVPDAELVPAIGGGQEVGVGVSVAVLGEPQPLARFDEYATEFERERQVGLRKESARLEQLALHDLHVS